MRKILLFWIFLCFIINGFAQCPSTLIELTSQEDIDNFAITYPGCSQILAGLTIEGGSSTTDLNGLSVITSVTGTLKIDSNYYLDYLTGLDNLIIVNGNLEIINTGLINCTGLGSLQVITGDLRTTSAHSFIGLEGLLNIAGDLNLQSNGYISNLQGLNNLNSIGGDFKATSTDLESFLGVNSLTSIGGDLNFSGNYDMHDYTGLESLISIQGNISTPSHITSFNGFDSLQLIGGNLNLANNSSIENLNGLNSIETILGDFTITYSEMIDVTSNTLENVGTFNISSNANLTNISLSALVNSGESFTIRSNPLITSIGSFTNYSNASGSLEISFNSMLSSFPSFENLNSIGGNLLINNNNSLLSVSGFPNLINLLGNLEITNSQNLTNISGFSSLDILGGLKVESNDNLQNIQGFNVLNSISNDLSIISNPNLSSLNTLHTVIEINGLITFQFNDYLTNINSFDSLQTTGGIIIRDNLSLTTISSFENLTNILGEFNIKNNFNLESFSGLNNLSTILGNLIFAGNSSLTQINGFESLTEIGDDLRIWYNDVLNSIPNLQSLTTIQGTFTLWDNPQILNLNELISLTYIGGNLFIKKNDLLTNVEGLNNLLTIGESLVLEEIHFDTGFDSLINVSEDITFIEVTALTQFSGLDSIESIGGGFGVSNSGFEHFYWPPNLSEVGEYVSFVNNGLDVVTGLNVLISIGTDLSIYANGGFNIIEMNSLTQIGGDIHMDSNITNFDHISFSSLISIGGSVDISHANIYLNFDSLESVGEFLTFDSIEQGSGSNTTIDLVMNSIEYIGGNILLNGKFDSLEGWENLTTVNGNLWIQSTANSNSFDMAGLDGLTSVLGNFFFNGGISSFTGLNNLESIEGDLNLRIGNYPGGEEVAVDLTGFEQLSNISGDFDFRGVINSLNGLDNLSTIGGNLNIYLNYELESLNGIESITSVGGQLFIENNTVLNNIDGLSNLDYNQLSGLRIRSNPELSECSILPVCGYLEIYSDYYISDNNSGCNDDLEILANCNTNIISGTILYDFDDDGCSNTDYYASSLMVDVTNGVGVYSTFTDLEGNYEIYVGEGTFTTSINSESLPQNFISNPESVETIFVGFDNEEIIDFCLTTTGDFNDVMITMLPIGQARPGFDSAYQLVFQNIGTTVLSGDVTLEFDNSRQTFLNANPSEDNITGNTISWNYVDLLPFESRTIDLTFNTLPPPVNELGDILVFTATINPIVGDTNDLDNVYQLNQTVVNSQDPNDKKVLQGSEILIEEVGGYLDYVIRFQNLGTADAINVRVNDVLSNHFNLNTFRPLSSSHDYRIEINNENHVSYIFENINLPSEQSDPDGSIGFITFQIKTKSDLIVGDIIENSASIFFDFNAAIETNTVYTEVVEPLGINDVNLVSRIKLTPNPVSEELTISISENIDLKRISVYSLIGKKLIVTADKRIDFSNLSEGMYFVEIETEQGTMTKKIIKK